MFTLGNYDEHVLCVADTFPLKYSPYNFSMTVSFQEKEGLWRAQPGGVASGVLSVESQKLFKGRMSPGR